MRGLGIPQSPISTRAVGMNGSGSMLDGMSGTNPAAITSIIGLSIGFNVVQNWRSSTSPGGEGSGSDAGVPFVTVVNRVKETPYYFAGSFGTYTDRDFGFVTTDTTVVNGIPVGYPRLARVARRHVGLSPCARLPKRQRRSRWGSASTSSPVRIAST